MQAKSASVAHGWRGKEGRRGGEEEKEARRGGWRGKEGRMHGEQR